MNFKYCGPYGPAEILTFGILMFGCGVVACYMLMLCGVIQ